MICGHSLYCDITDLEAICGDILKDQHLITNEVFRRKRDVISANNMRNQRISLYENIDGQRHKINIVFNLVGKYSDAVVTDVMHDRFVTQVDSVQTKLIDSSHSGDLDVEIGKDLLIAEKFQFSEYQFVCSPGSVPRNNVCGRHYNVSLI